MAVSAIAGTTTGTTGNGTSNANASLFANFDTFLTLLTTQLKNQSPLDPLDTNQFTQQLVQYSAVEQQIKTNAHMKDLVAATSSSNALAALTMVGKTVTALANEVNFTGTTTSWTYEATAVGTGTATIRDTAGSIVYQQKNIAFSEGSNKYVWDGRTNESTLAANGLYTIVFDANTNSAGTPALSTDITGKVTEIEFANGGALIKIGDQAVSLSKIKKVAQ
ncbi:MAG: flagellar hook assembly protein FlgD [Cohaesibacteraceae bacterium]|nr:flagellar hook assembly protein FlgD [Cohaesibacteraceae bacterium]MBL4876375.1 flagellar hook assembly protein FlgD [Cohaesibacteraceae bacterium]